MVINLGMFSEIGRWLDRLRDEKAQTETITNDASIAFRKAVNESQIYIGVLTRSRERNPSIEAEVSRHWSSAAQAIMRDAKKTNSDGKQKLANKCYSMSSFWASPSESSIHNVKALWNHTVIMSQEADDEDYALVVEPKKNNMLLNEGITQASLNPTCSFCKKCLFEVEEMYLGPNGKYICDRCIQGNATTSND